MTNTDNENTKLPREALWQRIAVGIFAAGIWFISILPTRLAYAIGDLLAVPWFLVWCVRDRKGRRSSGYWRNTAIAFREGSLLGPSRPKHHLWSWSRHIGQMVIDSCHMRHLTRENLPQHCDLSEYGPVKEVFDEGNGLIFTTGHIGVWDLSGVIAGLLDLPITSVFRPSPLPALNRLVSRMRSGTGQTMVARKNVMWTLKKVLGEKKVIGLIADGGGKHSAVTAPFLGTAARSVATPALLHLATGAPIVVAAIIRTGRRQYRLRVYDIIRNASTGPGNREKDLVAITTRCNHAVGKGIQEVPEQWLWHTRRFRHRPAGEQPGPDGLPPLSPMLNDSSEPEPTERYRSPRSKHATG